MTNVVPPGSPTPSLQINRPITSINDSTRIDALTRFRTVWLRAVAKAWASKDFADELEHGNAIDILETTFPPFVWPWKESLRLKVKKLENFVWIGDDWAWPADPEREESLKIVIPLTPPDDVEQYAEALADYYANRPSLLSDDPVNPASSFANSLALRFDSQVVSFFEDASVFGASRPAPLPRPNDGLVPSPLSFLDFQVALLSIIAKSWDNLAFRELIKDPKNATVGLGAIRGYKHPWRLRLAFADSEAKWLADEHHWDKYGKHELLLHLPQTPDLQDRAVALANYNGTGADFCFSCCA